MPKKSLQETMQYRCPSVISHFCGYHFGLSETQATDVFDETLRFLWLCARAYEDRQQKRKDVPSTMRVQSGMIVIDLMWHSFVLHTRQYAQFTEDHFGIFLHHTPTHDGFIPPTQQETELQLQYICDNAGGVTTLEKWYVEYAETYSVPKLRALQLPFDIIQ